MMRELTRTLSATILVENSKTDGLISEHGLSVHVSYGSLSLLVDFGQSDAFVRNAQVLGADLSEVDVAVLSHAHYDHADGMEAFCAVNARAPIYMSEACAENCWSTKGGTEAPHYIGMRPGTLERFASRIRPVPLAGVTAVAPGAYVVPHSTAGLSEAGRRAGMLVRDDAAWVPDDFAHEMSLVLELDDPSCVERRLVVVSSCSHAGCAVILNEVSEAFPGARIDAFIGGLHLVHATKDEVRLVAQSVREHSVGHLYTGHCTGRDALDILQRELPHTVVAMHPGMRFVC